MNHRNILFVVFLGVIVIGAGGYVANSQENERISLRRELYEYFWKFVMVGDGEPTTNDLKGIASYFSELDQKTITKIEQTHVSAALSNRQKREAICNLCPNVRHGTVVTRSGETYKGVIILEHLYRHLGSYRSSRDSTLWIDLTKGGETTVSWREIVEIDIREAKGSLCTAIVKTNRKQALPGVIGVEATILAEAVDPIVIKGQDIKRIVFGHLRRVQCPDCFRVGN
ncbi:hypothetical protein ES703_59446 [subsurface metagenome]